MAPAGAAARHLSPRQSLCFLPTSQSMLKQQKAVASVTPGVYQIRPGICCCTSVICQWARRKPGIMSERLLETHLLYQNPNGEILLLKTLSFSRMFPFSELSGVKAAWKEKKHVKRYAAENGLLFTSRFVLLWHWLPLFWAPLLFKMYLKGCWSRQNGFTGKRLNQIFSEAS